MARRKKLLKLIFGVLVGVLVSQFAKKEQVCAKNTASPPDPQKQQNLLFVGVLTAQKYLETRAAAVYNTWGRQVPGKIVFFSSENSHNPNLPIVALPDVDDSYPPQKKSFMMLKYIHDHYIDQFEWFIRADDDVYVRTDRLEELLRGIDSKKPWFIGQTGKGNTEEFGMLSLGSDENFCMGGPGVIFSRETLKRMAPYVEECLESLYTTHEDVELGRCVKRFAGISCTWSYEMQVILYHNQSGTNAFTGDLKQKEVHRAITLHPVKQPGTMYRLDKYVKGLKIQDYQQESLELHRDIASFMSELGYRLEGLQHANLVENLPLFPAQRGSPEFLGDTGLLGVQQKLTRYKPSRLVDVLDYELISKMLYTSKESNPRRSFGTSIKEGLTDIVRDVMEVINSFSKQRGRIIDFKEILYCYWRLDPVHGVDLILDLLLVYRKYRGHKMTVQVRRHAYVQQTFTGVFVKEVKNSKTTEMPLVQRIISSFDQKALNPQKLVNFVVPLSGRFGTFKRFLKMYEDVCLREREETRLLVVLHPGDDHQKTVSLISKTQRNFVGSDIVVISTNESFTRAKALELGVRHLHKDDLMVFMDVDMSFNSKTLQRFRSNTVQNKSIYFPIVYSMYNLSNKTNLSVDADTGFWRQFGFGIVGVYKSDYMNVGGLNLQISGWGYEDVSFYDNAVKSNLKIVRVIDPDLIHVYHPIGCDTNLDPPQRNMCLGTQASMLGSLKTLQKVYIKYKDLFS